MCYVSNTRVILDVLILYHYIYSLGEKNSYKFHTKVLEFKCIIFSSKFYLVNFRNLVIQKNMYLQNFITQTLVHCLFNKQHLIWCSKYVYEHYFNINHVYSHELKPKSYKIRKCLNSLYSLKILIFVYSQFNYHIAILYFYPRLL